MENISTLLKQIEDEKEDIEFVKTGFPKLDIWLDGGFFKQELVTLGAASGQGKSYIAGHFLHSAASQGFKTAYFSLEITGKMVASRVLGALCNIKPIRLMKGYLKPDEQTRKIEAKAKLLLLDDFIKITDNIYSLEKITKTIRENDFEFIVIDYVQIIRHAAISDEYSRLNEISGQLQEIAKEKNCCILLLSQLSNSVVREGSKSPVLEFKGSGSLGNVSDLGFIFEKNEYVKGLGVQHNTLTLKKNRRGVSGEQFFIEFVYPGGQFREYEPTK